MRIPRDGSAANGDGQKLGMVRFFPFFVEYGINFRWPDRNARSPSE